MARNLFGVMACLIVLLMNSGSAEAQTSVLTELYGQGVHTYFAHDYMAADLLLSRAIDNGSKDPRAHYFRGLARELCGGGGELDFEEGARLEAAGGTGVNVGMALTRIQGHLRVKIEKARQDARLHAVIQRQLMQQTTPAIPAIPMVPTLPVPPAETDPFPNNELRSEEVEVSPVPNELTEPMAPSDEAVNPFDDEPPGDTSQLPPSDDDLFGGADSPAEPAPTAPGDDPFSGGDAPAEVSPAAPSDNPFDNAF